MTNVLLFLAVIALSLLVGARIGLRAAAVNARIATDVEFLRLQEKNL